MAKPSTFDHDPIADTYDTKVRRAQEQTQGLLNYVRENYDAIQARVLEFASLAPALCVLDIGIGTGLMWEGNTVPVRLTGLDLSPRMLAKAKAKGLCADLHLGQFLELPFPNGSFDRVVSTFAFHHVAPEDKPRALSEIGRVLRPGGIFVLGDLMFRDEAQRQEVLDQMRAERRQDVLGGIDQEHYSDISLLRPVLAQLGFEVSFERGSTLSWIVRAAKP